MPLSTHERPYNQDLRRIRRYILHGVTALSLLLCVATATLWVRSYWRADRLTVDWGLGEDFRVESMSGGIYLSRGHDSKPVFDHYIESAYWDLDSDPDVWPRERNFDVPARRWRGVTTFTQRYKTSYVAKVVIVSDWLVFLALGIVPAIRLRELLRARRSADWLRSGRCSRCGYDMRATPDRCPECGAIPTNVKA